MKYVYIFKLIFAIVYYAISGSKKVCKHEDSDEYN